MTPRKTMGGFISVFSETVASLHRYMNSFELNVFI